jgi:hypothetical protein
MTYSVGDIIKGLKDDGFPDYKIFQILNDPGFNVSICDIASGFIENLGYDVFRLSGVIFIATGEWEDVAVVLNRVFGMSVDEIYDWLTSLCETSALAKPRMKNEFPGLAALSFRVSMSLQQIYDYLTTANWLANS